MAQNHRQNHRHTDGHGDSMTNSAQWGRVGENHFFQKPNLKAKIVTLLNIEPNYVFMLEIKTMLNHLQGHMALAVRFNMGIYWSKLDQNVCELEVLMLT